MSGHDQIEAPHCLCSGIPKTGRKHLFAREVGHYGIFSGGKFRSIIYP
ncbi:MAG: hypothetical protein NWS01_03355 [Burkholderiales bacterium]|nr:hypothetical protein [Burkholderiales bacterium]